MSEENYQQTTHKKIKKLFLENSGDLELKIAPGKDVMTEGEFRDAWIVRTILGDHLILHKFRGTIYTPHKNKGFELTIVSNGKVEGLLYHSAIIEAEEIDLQLHTRVETYTFAGRETAQPYTPFKSLLGAFGYKYAVAYLDAPQKKLKTTYIVPG